MIVVRIARGRTMAIAIAAGVAVGAVSRTDTVPAVAFLLAGVAGLSSLWSP